MHILFELEKEGGKNHMEPGWVSREVTLARQCFSLPGTVRCSGVVSRFIVMVKQPWDVLPQLSLLHSLRVTHCLRKLKCVQKMTFTGNLQHGLTMVTLKHIITTKTWASFWSIYNINVLGARLLTPFIQVLATVVSLNVCWCNDSYWEWALCNQKEHDSSGICGLVCFEKNCARIRWDSFTNRT